MSIIVDAHTGFPIALQLGGAAPRTAELGPVSTITVEASLMARTSHKERASIDGMLLGTVYKGNVRKAGWRTVVTWDRHRLTKRTGRQGGFSYKLLPGKYTITAYEPSGKICSRRAETIMKRRKRFVVLQCK